MTPDILLRWLTKLAASATVVPCLTTLVSVYGGSDQKGVVMGIFRSLGSLARATSPVFTSTGVCREINHLANRCVTGGRGCSSVGQVLGLGFRWCRFNSLCSKGCFSPGPLSEISVFCPAWGKDSESVSLKYACTYSVTVCELKMPHWIFLQGTCHLRGTVTCFVPL